MGGKVFPAEERLDRVVRGLRAEESGPHGFPYSCTQVRRGGPHVGGSHDLDAAHPPLFIYRLIFAAPRTEARALRVLAELYTSHSPGPPYPLLGSLFSLSKLWGLVHPAAQGWLPWSVFGFGLGDIS